MEKPFATTRKASGPMVAPTMRPTETVLGACPPPPGCVPGGAPSDVGVMEGEGGGAETTQGVGFALK